VDISSKLGTSFSLVPFVLVVVSILVLLPLIHVCISCECDYCISIIMAIFFILLKNQLIFVLFVWWKSLRLFPYAAILIFTCEIFQSICTILAMIATLPVVQLFFFHILLIKKVRLTVVWYVDYLLNTSFHFKAHLK